MKGLLDLPEDVFFNILQHFISSVEELIRLETVCKRIRQISLSRICWIHALETLESRPPLIASRSSLLDLSTDNLRREIIRAVKLDQSWKAEGGPLKTEDITICQDIREAKEYEVILPLPEVDLIFASYYLTGMHCWNISQKRLVWDYYIPHPNVIQREYGAYDRRSMEFACDVSNDLSTVLVALLFVRETKWVVQVFQIDTRSFNSQVLFESPPMPTRVNGNIGIIYHGLRICKNTIVVPTYNRETSQPALIVMNWREKTFYRILIDRIMEFGLAIALTQDTIFFVRTAGQLIWHQLESIQYGSLVGNSATTSKDWTSFTYKDLEDRCLCSQILLVCESSPKRYPYMGYLRFWMSAVVTTWSRTPTTHVTVAFNEMPHSRENSGVSIFDVMYTLDGDGKGLFDLQRSYYRLLLPMTFRTTPSVAIRALIQRETGLHTFVTANDSNDDMIEKESIYPLLRQYRDGKLGGISTWKAGMDSLGRMMAYQVEKNIILIRFD